MPVFRKKRSVQRLEERRTIGLDDKIVELIVSKSSVRRSSIRISVLPGQIVKVDVPLRTPDREISSLLARRGAWIVKKLCEYASQPQPAPLFYLPEEMHLYLGQNHPLRILARKQGRGLGQARLENEEVLVCLNFPEYDPALPEHAVQIKKIMRKWYSDQAMKYYSDFFNVKIRHIDWLSKAPDFSLRSLSRRWASCSAAGKLVVNRHLIKAPPECVAYVLLHEICHLRELNHSFRFYQLLTDLDPDWKQHRTLLTDLARQIVNE